MSTDPAAGGALYMTVADEDGTEREVLVGHVKSPILWPEIAEDGLYPHQRELLRQFGRFTRAGSKPAPAALWVDIDGDGNLIDPVSTEAVGKVDPRTATVNFDQAPGRDRTVIVVLGRQAGRTHLNQLLAEGTFGDFKQKTVRDILEDLERARKALTKPARLDSVDLTKRYLPTDPKPNADWKAQRAALDKRARRRW